MNVQALKSLNACEEAVEWVKTQPNAATAWRECQRGDWMLWLLGRLSSKPESADRRKLVLAACACARLSLQYVPKGDDRPRLAIETAERWARDEGPTLDKVRAAARAAVSVTCAAMCAACATDAAAYAASAAYAYAAAAADASDAAAYAAYAAAADAASDAAARAKTLADCADIVRKFYPRPPSLRRGKGG
jgi:hypothetical protein